MAGSVIIILLSAATVFLLICWFVGGSLVAAANCLVGPPPDGMSFESVLLKDESGGRIAAWYCCPPAAAATVLLVHGLRGNRLRMVGRAKMCLNAGAAVILIDMQAHGESPGRKITIGWRERENIAAAVAFARNRNPEHRIGVIGCSLGGAATLLSLPLPLDVLVLESVYPTIEEAIRNRLRVRLGQIGTLLTPFLLYQIRPRLGFSSALLRPVEHTGKIACPVLFAIGDQDRHTTVDETSRMYAAASEPKVFTVFPGAGHTDLLAHSPILYQNTVLPFLKKHLNLAVE